MGRSTTPELRYEVRAVAYSLLIAATRAMTPARSAPHFRPLTTSQSGQVLGPIEGPYVIPTLVDESIV